jgi:signal transduction histidine kinase
VWRDEDLVYLEGFLIDVTERVRAEESLRSAQQALIEQQQRENARVREELARVEDDLVKTTRLATIGKMAAQIAHEIRNPLGTIKNSAFFARRKLPEDETLARENLDLVQNEVAVCVNIIENILSITKLQPPRKAPLDLAPFVAEAFERLKENSAAIGDPQQLACRYDADSHPVTLQADHSQFRQVLDNLLKNASEVMAGRGEIRVSARQSPPDTCIEVSDTGPGVPADQVETIFELFQTSKPKGTGLGLGISRQIIERHGGTLTVKLPADGAAGQGATFVIILPRVES